jgi:hypothetical protein
LGTVAGVENEAVSVHDRCWPDVGLIGPEDRTRRGAGSTQDALRGVVLPRSFFRRLDPLALCVLIVHEVGDHGPIAFEEGFHVDDEVL